MLHDIQTLVSGGENKKAEVKTKLSWYKTWTETMSTVLCPAPKCHNSRAGRVLSR